jgi:carbon storage regulator
MLVLTRKLKEKLYIGDNICLTVVRFEGGQVRLGIEAPREISVVRAELVPDRQLGQTCRAAGAPAAGTAPVAGATAAPGTAAPTQAPARGDVKTPPAWAHESDSRRRGRSR